MHLSTKASEWKEANKGNGYVESTLTTDLPPVGGNTHMSWLKGLNQDQRRGLLKVYSSIITSCDGGSCGGGPLDFPDGNPSHACYEPPLADSAIPDAVPGGGDAKTWFDTHHYCDYFYYVVQNPVAGAAYDGFYVQDTGEMVLDGGPSQGIQFTSLVPGSQIAADIISTFRGTLTTRTIKSAVGP